MSFTLANVTEIYAKDPQLKKQDVDTVFKWLKTQPHLPEITELQAILFLHSCCYVIDSTKTTIENYFTLKTSSGLFQSAAEEMIKRVLFIDFLPKKTPEGYVIFLLGLVDPEPQKYVCVEVVKLMIMIICWYFHQHGPENGLVLLTDLQNTSFGHVFRMNLSAIKTISHFLQESVPTRLKGIHYVNTVSVTRPLIALGQPFMKKEVYEMIKCHNSVDSLHEHIPKYCLPEEYGGELGPRLKLHERNLKNLLQNLDFFKWHDGQKVDESKRIRKTQRGFFRN